MKIIYFAVYPNSNSYPQQPPHLLFLRTKDEILKETHRNDLTSYLNTYKMCHIKFINKDLIIIKAIYNEEDESVSCEEMDALLIKKINNGVIICQI